MLVVKTEKFNGIASGLNDMIALGNPFTIPAKKYVHCLTKHLERLRAAKIIVQHENDQLKAHVHEMKRQLSRKRQVIDGKHIITAAELEGIREAEKTTEAKKGKQRNKAPRKKGSMASKKLTEESEVELESSEDEACEILDCVVVES